MTPRNPINRAGSTGDDSSHFQKIFLFLSGANRPGGRARENYLKDFKCFLVYFVISNPRTQKDTGNSKANHF